MRRLSEPSDLERKLFAPVSIKDGLRAGEKGFDDEVYLNPDLTDKYHSFLGTNMALVVGGFSAILETIIIPTIPFVNKNYWWVPIVALSTNLASYVYEKRREIKKELMNKYVSSKSLLREDNLGN